MTRIILICTLISFFLFAGAQITFQKTYGGIDDEGLNDLVWVLQDDTDQGYIIAGTSNSFGGGDNDFYLVRTDENGEVLWSKTYGGAGDDQCYSIVYNPSGGLGYALAGRTNSYGTGMFDMYMLLVDDSGIPWRSETYGMTDSEYGWAIRAADDFGDYIFCGGTTIGSNTDITLVKTGFAGDTMFVRTFGGWADDNSWSLELIPDSGYVVVGYTKSFGAGLADMYLIRTNRFGDTLWTRSFGGPDDEEGYGIESTFDGGVIAVGYTKSFGTGADKNMYIVKTNWKGDSIWTKAITVGTSCWLHSVIQLQDDTYMAVGTVEQGPDTSKIILIRLSELGGVIWAKTYGSGISKACSVEQTTDNGFIISGVTYDSITKGDIILIKTDSLGNSICSESLDSLTVSSTLTAVDAYALIGVGLDTLHVTPISQMVTTTTVDFCDSIMCGSPMASFSYVDSALVVVFSDSSVNTTNWLWDFGDGNTDTVQNPTYTYSTDGTYNTCLYAFNQCNTDTICQIISITGVGIDQSAISNHQSLIIYPNPNTGQFTLEMNLQEETKLTIKLYHFTGQLIQSEEIGNVTGNYTQQMDLSKYAKGIYYVQIMTENSVVTEKVVYQ